jgi:hypothetical protein
MGSARTPPRKNLRTQVPRRRKPFDRRAERDRRVVTLGTLRRLVRV